jgi:hypothetical protein
MHKACTVVIYTHMEASGLPHFAPKIHNLSGWYNR